MFDWIGSIYLDSEYWIGFGRRQRKLYHGKRYTSIFLGDHDHGLQSPAKKVDSWGQLLRSFALEEFSHEVFLGDE